MCDKLGRDADVLEDVVMLIPVWNDPTGLDRALASIVEDERVRVVIVDDGSNPPVKVTAPERLDATLIRLDENQGIENALNAGLEYIDSTFLNAKFVARLDAGDLSTPFRLARQRAAFTDCSDLVVVGGPARFVDAHGEYLFSFSPPTADHEIRLGMYRNNMIVHAAAMYDLKAALAVGGYPQGYAAKEDHEFFWRLLDVGQAASTSSTEVIATWTREGISGAQRRQQVRTGIRIISQRWRANPVRAGAGIARNIALLLVPIGLLNRVKGLWRKERQPSI